MTGFIKVTIGKGTNHSSNSQAGWNDWTPSISRNNVNEIPSQVPQKALFFLCSYHCGITTMADVLLPFWNQNLVQLNQHFLLFTLGFSRFHHQSPCHIQGSPFLLPLEEVGSSSTEEASCFSAHSSHTEMSAPELFQTMPLRIRNDLE